MSNERGTLELFQESINIPNTSDQELNEEEEEIFSSDEEGEEEIIERSAPLKYPETLSPRKTPTPLTPSHHQGECLYLQLLLLVNQNTLPKRIPLPPSPIETESLSTLSPGKISIFLSPSTEKDKDSTISDEAKKVTVK